MKHLVVTIKLFEGLKFFVTRLASKGCWFARVCLCISITLYLYLDPNKLWCIELLLSFYKQRLFLYDYHLLFSLDFKNLFVMKDPLLQIQSVYKDIVLVNLLSLFSVLSIVENRFGNLGFLLCDFHVENLRF